MRYVLAYTALNGALVLLPLAAAALLARAVYRRSQARGRHRVGRPGLIEGSLR